MVRVKKYWAYAGERALKTVAQVAIATIGVGAVGVLDVDWVMVANLAAGAGVMSLLTSVLQFDRPAK